MRLQGPPSDATVLDAFSCSPSHLYTILCLDFILLASGNGLFKVLSYRAFSFCSYILAIQSVSISFKMTLIHPKRLWMCGLFASCTKQEVRGAFGSEDDSGLDWCSGPHHRVSQTNVFKR